MVRPPASTIAQPMFTFDPNEPYVMPAHFGPRPVRARAGGRYGEVTAITVSYRTDPEQLAQHLPAPFSVGEDATLSVVYAQNRRVEWLAGRGYNMIAVSASAVFDGRLDRLVGSYALVTWENLTDPILTGRELQGIPKVYADIPDHTVGADEWRVGAGHFGHGIVDLAASGLRELTDDEIDAGRDAQAGHTAMGWRYLPGVGGSGEAVSEPTAFPSENDFTSVRMGRGRVFWHELTWEQNPTQFHIVNALAELPVLEYGPAFVTTGSTNLVLDDRPSRALS